jgi:hypothetical protein
VRKENNIILSPKEGIGFSSFPLNTHPLATQLATISFDSPIVTFLIKNFVDLFNMNTDSTPRLNNILYID